MPSEDMGDYVEYRKKRVVKKGPLYPLNEEGSYGAPPSPLPKPLPGYQKRERKPKVYSGYAISSDCSMHAEKLEDNMDHSHGKAPVAGRRRAPSFSRPTPPRPAPTPARRASTLPRARPAAPARPVAPAQDWQTSLRGASASRELEPRPRAPRPAPREPEPRPEPGRRPRSVTPERERARRSLSSEGPSSARSSTGSADWGYTSYSSFLNGARTASSSSGQSSHRTPGLASRPRKASLAVHSFKESEEQQSSRSGKVSLKALETPIISPWDNMGILGLSSKMYSDTSVTKQNSFSASSFVRKESVTSHAM